MTTKSKDFQLSAENIFKNELIHFFNINANNSIINIYLEIEGKRMKPEKPDYNSNKLLLNQLALKNSKKEINRLIYEDAELKMLIRIIRKYNKYFRKKSNTFYKKSEDIRRQREMQNISPNKKIIKEDSTKQNNSPEIKITKTGISIKERIKLFSGEFIKRQNENKIIPGRLIMPKIFQENEEKNKKKETETIVNDKENNNKSDKKIEISKEKEESNS